jgi:hypothetical protein
MSKKPTRTPDRKHPLSREPRACTVPDCGRPVYAKGCCQTHHRQLLATGELKEIRPYRQRTPGTEKLSGLRLSPHCIECIQEEAERENLSPGAVISRILEDWVRRGARR